MSQETIVAKAYELLKYSLPIIEKLPRTHKFTLGDRLESHMLDILEGVIEAYYTPKSRKLYMLDKLNILLEKSRYLIRLGFEMGFYRSNHYKEWAEKINEIGRMVGGWKRSIK